MRSVIGVLLLSSSALACIGGSSGGGCCAPSAGAACAPSAPPCGGGGPNPYASSGSYPRPIAPAYSPGAGGSYAAPPSFSSFPSAPAFPSLPSVGAPIGGGSYQQAPSAGFSGSSFGGAGSYHQAPSGPIGGAGSYQQGPSAPIGGAGSYQAAPVLSSPSQLGGSYQSAPVGGSYQSGPAAVQSIPQTAQIGGGSYQSGPAAVVSEVHEVVSEPVVAPVAPAYGEKAVINNGPTTITKQTEVATQTETGYGAKEEEYEEVEQVKTTPAATYEKPAAVVQTTVVEKNEQQTVTGHEATEYEYEEEEKPTPVAPVIAPEPVAVTPAVVTVTDNYKAAAVQQNGQTEHTGGSEAAISTKGEPSAYSAEETATQTAGASYEAVEQDGEEQPKQVEASQVAIKTETETTYDDEEAEKKEEEPVAPKEEYKRNTIKRNSANRA